jgi:FKBP12-rapamycin complex-associated protein
MVSDELIRTAILWHEQWHEGLEEASRLYFGERNIPGMLVSQTRLDRVRLG